MPVLPYSILKGFRASTGRPSRDPHTWKSAWPFPRRADSPETTRAGRRIRQFSCESPSPISSHVFERAAINTEIQRRRRGNIAFSSSSHGVEAGRGSRREWSFLGGLCCRGLL